MPKEISFKISRLQFWIVALLILLLPLSSKYKLIIWGKKTTGKVVHHHKVGSGLRLGGNDTFSVIQFKADSVTVRMYGPENTIYELGESITVFYNKNNPEDCLILTFAYIYTGRSAIIPFVLLLLWIAFYMAFKDKQGVKPTSPNDHQLT